VVGATVRQLKSYAELVQELEAGLDAFKAKAVTDEAVAQYMADAYPAAAGGTAIAAGQTYDKALYQQIIARCGAIDGLADPGDATAMFTEDNVQKIQDKSRETLNRAAEGSFEQLRTLLQMGYSRVVFTNGRVKSKLTFDVQATDNRSRTTSDMAQSAFQASASMGGGIFGAILGVSGSTSYKSIHVRTVNTSSVEADRVTGDILGEVEVNFATQSFPAVDVKPQAPAKPANNNPQ
jgi:hypothetical protein